MALSADDGDLALIAAAQQGERRALDLFVRRHDRWVRSVVYATAGNAHAIDDIAQQVWAKVWQQIGTLAEPARWRGWLYRLARNAAIDAGQKAARDRGRQVALADEGAIAGRQLEPSCLLIRDEQHRRTLMTIRGLPAIYREPFVLRHMEDCSYAEIAEALSLPVDTVETRLVRARRLLRSALKDLRADKEPDR